MVELCHCLPSCSTRGCLTITSVQSDSTPPITNNTKMCRLALILTTALTLLITVTINHLVPALGQLSELGDDRVTLKTVDAGSFVGQRVAELQLGPSLHAQDPNALPRSYFAFRGIPYAQAERWGRPAPAEVRRTPRIATVFKPSCPQWEGERRRVVGSQECLFLNVFTPYVPSSVKRPLHSFNSDETANLTSWTVENRNLLPVLVFIHGGEFLAGGSQLYGPDRFMKEDVVLVTVNYRLGLLGFLSNGEESLPGNYGLLDQIEALRWIQQNIFRFGGNPLRVCIFGSVEYLLLAHGVKGLFHSAILSPSSTSTVFSPQLSLAQDSQTGQNSQKELFRLVGREVGCGLSDDEQILQCLGQIDADALVRVQHRVSKFFSYPPHPGGMSPGVDGSLSPFPLLPDQPGVLLKEGRFLSSVPLMVGSSAFEGFNPFFEFYLKLGPDRERRLRDKEFLMMRLESTLKTILGFDQTSASSEFHRIFLSVWDFYFGSFEDKWSQQTSLDDTQNGRVLWKLFRLFGDLTVNSGQRRLVQLLSAHSKAPVFNYIFNASSDQFNRYLQQRLASSAKIFGSGLLNSSTFQERGFHSTEIPPWKELYYLFEPLDQPEFPPIPEIPLDSNGKNGRNLTQEEESLSAFLVRLWVSFAKYGSPKQGVGSSGRGGEGRWTKASSAPSDGSLNYFVLGVKSYPLRGDFRKAETGFWLSVLPQIQALSEQISELEPFPTLLWIFVGLTSVLVFISIILIFCICCGGRGSRGGRGKAKF